ncbi:MAG: hypothetical protein HYT08_04015 [Candidatus Levybacteria bacterium]|nr:hypothetical protein [Candidatus Levybacteria bacterium]
MKNKIVAFAFFGVIFLLLSLETMAAPQSLSISPPVIAISAIPPADVSAQFWINNLEKEPVEIQIILRPFTATDKKNGEVESVESNQLSIEKTELLNKIRIYDGEKALEGNIILAPKQKKKLNLRVNIPENYTSLDLYFSIIFLSLPKNDSKFSHSQISQGIASNVLLSIVRNNKIQAEISRFDSKTFFNDSPIEFDLEITNKGSSFISPQGNITIKNIFGKTVGRIKLDSVNILSNSSRLMSNYNEQENKIFNSSSRSNETKIYLPKRFILGYYTAELNISLSDNSPTISKSLSFIAFPVKYAIIVLIGLFATLTLAKKVARKLKNR